MAEESRVTLTQDKSDEFSVHHNGEVAVFGSEKQAAIQHVIQSSEKQPIVHMVCWDEEEPCAVDERGRVTLAGDEKSPIALKMIQEKPCEVTGTGRVTMVGDEKSPLRVRMTHIFEDTLVQEHKLTTHLAEPIHHALQMRSPLELRFCNPWHFASDYMVEVTVADSRMLSIRLTGATIANPQPCSDQKPCPPLSVMPTHP